MSSAPVIVGLPIADRRTSYAFYSAGLGFATVGEPADDGVPEPLQLALNEGVRIMLIPTGGFRWVTGGREVASSGHSECLLTISVAAPAEVDEFVERAHNAGAEIVTEPAEQPWGYAGIFTDPDGHLWQVTVAAPPWE